PRVAGVGKDRLDIDAIDTLAREGRYSRLYIVGGLRRKWADDETEPARYLLGLGKAFDGARVVSAEQQPYAGRRRQGVLEKLDALAGQPLETLHHRHAGDVAARPRQACGVARTDRIAGHQDDRNGCSHTLDGAERK